MSGVSPVVKWAGGKGQLLAQLEPYLPAEFGGYVEPFVGGGAVFFALYNQGRLDGKQAILIDRLEELINCYTVVRDQVEELIPVLRSHEPLKLERDYYYRVRNWDRDPGYARRGAVERAARFLYLNHTCYNGLYRVNRRGEFNVPFGRYHNPMVCDEGNLRAASRALAGVSLRAGDFELCFDAARPGDLVYLDPPYQPVSVTANFTGYTAGSFDIADQQRLAGLFRELVRRGCWVLLSNSDTPLVRELYAGYEQVPVRAGRAINARGDGRGAITEILVVGRTKTAWDLP